MGRERRASRWKPAETGSRGVRLLESLPAEDAPLQWRSVLPLVERTRPAGDDGAGLDYGACCVRRNQGWCECPGFGAGACRTADMAPARGGIWFFTHRLTGAGAGLHEPSSVAEPGRRCAVGLREGGGAGSRTPAAQDDRPRSGRAGPTPVDTLVDDLMFPDGGNPRSLPVRQAVWPRAWSEAAIGAGRALSLPDEGDWRLVPTASERGLDGTAYAEPVAALRPLEEGEVRVAVEAVGLNFSDVLISMGAVEMAPMLGDEFCGRITEVAPDVSEFSRRRPGAGPWGSPPSGPNLVTRSEMTAPAPLRTCRRPPSPPYPRRL